MTQIGSNARLDGATGKYVYLGVGQTAEHQDEVGIFIQDAWHARPNLTLNGGLRWQIALPFVADESVYPMNTMADLCGVSGVGNGPGGRECNLFNPGVFNPGGRTPVYELYKAGDKGYNTEYGNLAPNVGLAWQPNVQSGWIRKILGDPAQATIRASFGVAYNSDGLSFYTGVYGSNPATRSRQTVRPRARSSRSSQRGRPGPCSSAIPAASAPRLAFPTPRCIRWRSTSTAASACSIRTSGRRTHARIHSASSAR